MTRRGSTMAGDTDAGHADACLAEAPGIGLYSEKGLHAALKSLYASGNGRLEAKLGGKVVDVVLPHELVEVQTRNIGSIVNKILHLATIMPVRVVHPITVALCIERIDPLTGASLSKRKSTVRRDLYSLFDELVRASLLVASPNVRFDVVLVHVHERRSRTGKGSWRKKGDEVLSRRLEAISETIHLDTRQDWINLLPPPGDSGDYDSAGLGSTLGINSVRAGKILYTYAKAGLLKESGKKGNRKLYRLVD